ncbi:MAG: BlaI/MecI/CopY family transcriptional regulator [Lachnospiraceae bacterium]|jgi:BlaI family penicillinase repressor|nr:BlaI/MecI/CopY family transcriptional regulator [Lachnospiraceae bacterium]
MTKKVHLSDAEWRIMNLLWEQAPRTMMQITNALKAETNWTKHTVISFLKRMEEKGALYHEEGEKAKLYFPSLNREEAALQETEDFLGRVFRGRMGMMLNTMVRQQALSKEELQELHKILEQAEEDINRR